jgi:hypothetical protein
VVELNAARIIHANAQSATAIFDNPAFTPVSINPGRIRLHAGARLLIEVRFAAGRIEAAHWFLVGAAPVPVPVRRKPPVPTVPVVEARITRLAPDGSYCFAQAADGGSYFVSARECAGPVKFNVHRKVRFIPSQNERGPYALEVRAA